MNINEKKIIIISGDPNSINSEIIFKSWNLLPNKIKKRIILISNYKLLKEQFKILKYKIHLIQVKDLKTNSNASCLKIIDIKLNFKNPFNISRKSSSKYILNSLNLAHKLALSNNVAGIINCPISKELLIKKNIESQSFLLKNVISKTIKL